MMMLAVMVILVIFVFIIFAIFAFRNERKHDGLGDGMGAIAPVLAAGMVANKPHYDYGHDAYDFAKFAKLENHSEHLQQITDQLKTAGELKLEIKDSQYQMTRDIDRNHYDTLAVVKEDGEKTRALIVQQEREKMLAEIAYLRSRDLHHGFTGNKATVNVQDIGVGYGGYGY